MRLSDIAGNARRILTYTEGMSYADFAADEKTSDATERCMMRISEAAIKLGSFAEELLPAHDWQSIRGIGNVLRHDYDQVSLPRIWESIGKNSSRFSKTLNKRLRHTTQRRDDPCPSSPVKTPCPAMDRAGKPQGVEPLDGD